MTTLCLWSGSLSYQEFIKLKGYSHTTNIETVNDGGESALFKQLFQSWRVKGQTVGLGRTHSVGRVGEWCNLTRSSAPSLVLHNTPVIWAGVNAEKTVLVWLTGVCVCLCVSVFLYGTF